MPAKPRIGLIQRIGAVFHNGLSDPVAEQLMQNAKRLQNPQETQALLGALGQVKDPAHVAKIVLAVFVSTDRSQMRADSPQCYQALLDFIKAKVEGPDGFPARFTAQMVNQAIKSMPGTFLDEQQAGYTFLRPLKDLVASIPLQCKPECLSEFARNVEFLHMMDRINACEFVIEQARQVEGSKRDEILDTVGKQFKYVTSRARPDLAAQVSKARLPAAA